MVNSEYIWLGTGIMKSSRKSGKASSLTKLFPYRYAMVPTITITIDSEAAVAIPAIALNV